MSDSRPVTPQTPYTFVRIKRKRTDAPLDALVFESDLSEPSRPRKKKALPGVNVFQFASTVEDSAWDDRTQKDIQDRIAALARVQSQTQTQGKPIAPLPKRKREPDAPQPQYTIVPKPTQETTPVSSSRRPTAPPKVLSAKDLEASKSKVKVYDAVLAPPAVVLPSQDDSEFEKFNDLLQEYLNVNDIAPSPSSLASNKAAASIQDKAKSSFTQTPTVIPTPGNGSTNTKPSTTRAEDEDPDYVWDVFFHRPGALQDYSSVGNVGTLTGLPASFGDPYESDSDSEPEDEADEDSNDEGYYKNDYPDEDSDEWSSEGSDATDEWHEDSEYDDGEVHEWR